MFLTRVLTVLVILPLFAAALLFLPQWLWALVLLPALYVAAWEWAGLAGYTPPRRAGYAVLTAASGLALFYAAFAAPAHAAAPELWTYALSCVFWFTLAPFWLGARWKMRNPVVLAVAGWIALVPMWLALVRLQAHPYILLMFMAVVWIADTAAYLAGKRWGRRKLAPLISPGKSWEGVAGAAAALGIYYAVLWFSMPGGERLFSPVFGLTLFAVLLALSIEGDLFESWMKRQAGVKDSGQLLPGHGGLLDRIDGLTSTMPTAALALYLASKT
jgi:phosphatidate cytidylyltransferase